MGKVDNPLYSMVYEGPIQWWKRFHSGGLGSTFLYIRAYIVEGSPLHGGGNKQNCVA